jgi:hypothetical protein
MFGHRGESSWRPAQGRELKMAVGKWHADLIRPGKRLKLDLAETALRDLAVYPL